MKSEYICSDFNLKIIIFFGLFYTLYSTFEKLSIEVFCTEVNFYFIEDKYTNEIGHTEQLYKLRIPKCSELKEYKAVFLLKNRIIMCKSIFNRVDYFSYKILKIDYPNHFILESKVIESYIKSGKIFINIFLGDLSSSGWMKFFKLIGSLDGFTGQIQLNEFIQFSRFLSVLKMKRTKNKKLFLKYFVLHAIMDPRFSEKYFHFLETSYEKYEDLNKRLINEIFNIFLDFNLVERNRESCLFKPEIKPEYSSKIKTDFFTYKYTTKKYNKETNLRITDNDLKSMHNVINDDVFIARFRFLIRMMNIDLLFVNISERTYEKFLLSFFKIKPNKLTKIFLIKKSIDQYILNILINVNYFDNIDIVKIYSEFEVEKIDHILEMCTRSRKIMVLHEVFIEKMFKSLLKFAKNNKNIFLKHQIEYFELCFENVILLQNIPENMNIIIQKIDFAILAGIRLESICIYDFIKNIELTLEKNIKWQEIIPKCVNVKSISIISRDLECNLKFKRKWIKYFEIYKYLEILFFETIILPKEMLSFILHSNFLIYVCFKETKLPKCFEIKPNIHRFNTRIRGISFSSTNIVLRNSFLKYIARFLNLEFLKLDIAGIKKNILKKIKNRSKTANFHAPKPILKYLEIKASLDIREKRLSILNILSKYFEIRYINSLIIQAYHILPEEYMIITNLIYLENLYLHLHKKTYNLALNMFENIDHKSKIINLTLDIYRFNYYNLLSLKNLKNLKFFNLFCYEIDCLSIKLLGNNKFIDNLIIKITIYGNKHESFTAENILREFRREDF